MSIAYWKDLAERAAMTAIETLLALMLADGVFDVLTFDWGSAITVTLSAVVLAVAKALAAGQIGDGSASLARVKHEPPLR